MTNWTNVSSCRSASLYALRTLWIVMQLLRTLSIRSISSQFLSWLASQWRALSCSSSELLGTCWPSWWSPKTKICEPPPTFISAAWHSQTCWFSSACPLDLYRVWPGTDRGTLATSCANSFSLWAKAAVLPPSSTSPRSAWRDTSPSVFP